VATQQRHQSLGTGGGWRERRIIGGFLAPQMEVKIISPIGRGHKLSVQMNYIEQKDATISQRKITRCNVSRRNIVSTDLHCKLLNIKHEYDFLC
jgi:hypothetical protein